MATPPLELTGEEFVVALQQMGEVPPCVPVDKYDCQGPHIKRSGLLPYETQDGREIDVLIFHENALCLVSKRVWAALGGKE